MSHRIRMTRLRVTVPLGHFQIIVKTFLYYKTSPDVMDPTSRDPSLAQVATTALRFKV